MLLPADRVTHAERPGSAPPAAAPPTPFDQLYASYAPLLRKIAVRKFNVPHGEADALVHDVFARYLINQSAIRELHPYLIGAICNAARRYWRREGLQRELCTTTPCAATPDDALLNEVVRNITIGTTLARLGASCRDTLRRFYLYGESTAAIAEARNTSSGYIRRLLTLCRSRAQAIYRTMEGDR